MGFRFRRSINLRGGFRLNASKSGFGFSWGIPGVRLTRTATKRNRLTLSLPGTGLSYVKESSAAKKKRTSSAGTLLNVIEFLSAFFVAGMFAQFGVIVGILFFLLYLSIFVPVRKRYKNRTKDEGR